MSLSLGDFETLVDRAFELREQVELKEGELKKINESLAQVNAKIAAELEGQDKNSHMGRLGRVTRVAKFSVKNPQTDEDKALFFAWLQEKGVFHQMVGVNHNTLNSLYKAAMEEAREKGETDFAIPGIGEPSFVEILQLRRNPK